MDYSAYLSLVGWIAVPILIGIGLQHAGVPRRISRVLFGLALFGPHTIISFFAIWAARVLEESKYLPLLTLAGWLIAAVFAWGLSRWMEHDPRRRGSFILVICMSNNGYTLLGIIALVLFGQKGLSQGVWAQLLLTPFLLLFSFPLGRYYGAEGDMPMGKLLRQVAADPRNLPLLAMLAGLALNLTGYARPQAAEPVISGLMYFGVTISGIAVGLLFRDLGLKKYFKENVVAFMWRVTLYPLMFYGMALLFNLGALDTKILILYGLVPAALFANLVADFFRLDTHLTSSVFIVGTFLFLLLVLPVYVWLAAA